eukprot:scaffold747_cov145-Skeletonema_menzelii.AAC.5
MYYNTCVSRQKEEEDDDELSVASKRQKNDEPVAPGETSVVIYDYLNPLNAAAPLQYSYANTIRNDDNSE